MSSYFFLHPVQWAQAQWGHAELGDIRRTRRAVKLGAAIAAQSAASLPKQTQDWGDLKAAYRLLNEEAVTHTQLSLPHWQTTRWQATMHPGTPVLFVQDMSELDFSAHRRLEGAGHLSHLGYGFLLHSCLALLPDAVNPTLLGLAHQTVWKRDIRRRRTETKIQRQKRRNEADIWAETVEAIGPVPAGACWVSVGDRASDIFSYVRRARALGWHGLVRVNQDRRITAHDGKPGRLKPYVRALAAQATKTVVMRGKDGMPARQVVFQVAWTSLTLAPPATRAERHERPQPGWCMRVWNDTEEMEWMLFSTLPLDEGHGALEQIGWYEHRWLIEEYHKCLKTGCAIEKRRLTTAGGLLALLGFLALTAVRILQLRSLARANPQQSAGTAHIEPLCLQLMAARLNTKPGALSVAQFWRGVATLGGFIGRTGDGEPGWQTLWEGWRRLQDMCWGALWMET